MIFTNLKFNSIQFNLIPFDTDKNTWHDEFGTTGTLCFANL